ncbi:DUF7662 domain-containing protein [Cetobacterium sp.]|uniref:DUF7662 domain-containing protein n=1 Tax=Cetobacterium sp. TaxID=2071632 RepID=UPI003F2D6880
MDREYLRLKELFLKANKKFLEKDRKLLIDKVSERTLCGALMLKLYEVLKETEYSNYYVDVEYNRNEGEVKTIYNGRAEVIKVNCDLIVHSRGENTMQDNLIAIEMKKNEQPFFEKEDDRIRLSCLTKDSFDDNIWSYDGKTLPKHVCRYKIGIFYEVNLKRMSLKLEYYYQGNKIDEDRINFKSIKEENEFVSEDEKGYYNKKRLIEFLKNQEKESIEITYAQMEELLGRKLPKSAYEYQPYLSNTYSQPIPPIWLNLGYKQVKLVLGKYLILEKIK